MQDVNIYGKLIENPQVKFIKSEISDFCVTSYDVEVMDNEYDTKTIFHCIAFNNLAQDLLENLQKGSLVFMKGLMKDQYRMELGQTFNNLIFIVQSINIEGTMYISADMTNDLKNLKEMNLNYINI